ncbi:MAG: hypothetical protein IPK13_18155 [Deltaproteobacteria bacterium]|nr:hypothetical protein [Deltaproteobacteria bacterium]
MGVLVGASGCVRSYALGAAADALSASGKTFSSDDDPELIEAATPFALKTMESVLEQDPTHRGLLTSLASGFTQYGYAFVKEEADRQQEEDFDRASTLRLRARKLFMRARDYAVRGLEVEHPGFRAVLADDVSRAVADMTIEDVPLLYWLAASMALVVATGRDEPSIFADYTKVRPIAQRALDLDESWEMGVIHDLFISIESGFPDGRVDRAREHFARSIALAGGRRVGTYVSFAEGVSVKTQNLKEFQQMLDAALAIPVDDFLDGRLANVIMRRRAVWLKARVEDLFLDVSEREDARPSPTVDTVGRSDVDLEGAE